MVYYYQTKANTNMKKYSHLLVLSFVSLGVVALAFVSISKIGPSDPVTTAETPESSSAVPKITAGEGVPVQKKNAKKNKEAKSPSASTIGYNEPSPAQQPSNTVPAYPRKEPTIQTHVTIDDKQYPLHTYTTTAIPNDPDANQWWVQNTKLPQTWDIQQGNNETKLAVIDTGFALQHEEFENRWLKNTGEQGMTASEAASSLNCEDRGIALNASCNLIDDDFDTIVDNESGATSLQNPSRLNCTDQFKPITKECNRIDDDGNGYIDDVTGFDFVNFDSSVQAGETNPTGDGTTHGTLTSGIAAATGNNGKGIAGVDWQTKILPIQALDDDSYGDTRTVGRAINYAVSQNVDVISLSLGGSGSDAYVQQAVQAAIKKGITVVASSGNGGGDCANNDCVLYPANYPEVIAVGALNESNQRASFSSYGANLDFLAPGTNMTSPTWSSGNGISAYASGINGTSFSAPLVSGLLTRLLSQRPDMTPQQQYAAISEDLNRLSITTGRSNTLGFGTVDTLSATQRVTNPSVPGIQYAFTPVSMGDYFSSSSPTDQLGTYYSQKCDDNKYGTTKMYELTKGSTTFFSISHVEAANALNAGYTSKQFAYVCLQQPQDAPETIRTLNILREFKNLDSKNL